MVKELEKQALDLLMRNRLAEAEAVYRQLCDLEPDNASRRVDLGNVRQRLGRYADAEADSRRALALQSDLPAAHLLLGTTLHRQGRRRDAIASYREVIRLDPACAEAHYHLANALRETGDADAAVKAYQRLLQTDPRHFEGLNNLGFLLVNLGNSQAAIPCLRRALQLQPDSLVTLVGLGEACIANRNYPEALQHLQHAVRIAPDSPRAWQTLASAQHHAGRLQDALASYATLARLQPDSADATLGRARILEQLGKFRETHELLKPLLRAGHDDAIHTFFNISKKIGKRDEAAAALQGILKRTGLRDESAASVHFKLGRYYDETGEYDRAFRHYRQANELTPQRFSKARLATFVDDNISVYNSEFIAQMPLSDSRSELPVFIVGMPRSGTSLVEQILASHPGVTGAGELPQIPEIVQRLTADFPGYVYPLFVPGLSRESLNSAAQDHLKTLQGLGGAATRVTDKLPHNFRNIGLLFQLFPAARIIHCSKHPLDACLSCYFAELGTTAHGYSYNLETIGEYYIQYRRLMEHWQNVFPGRILTVPYRELVLEQEKTSRQLIEFIGMEWNDCCLDFHNTDRFVFTLSYDQVRQPMYTSSLDRWRHYERQLQPLRDKLEAGGISCE